MQKDVKKFDIGFILLKHSFKEYLWNRDGSVSIFFKLLLALTSYASCGKFKTLESIKICIAKQRIISDFNA